MKRTHGHTRWNSVSRTYSSWCSMIQRCTNSKNHNYPRYGGRGITVCERWRKFANFLADMSERPNETTLDRINNDGNYEPSNCRWATWTEQARSVRGELQAVSKLSNADVEQIRKLHRDGFGPTYIARKYSVVPSTICHITKGRTWAWLK